MTTKELQCELETKACRSSQSSSVFEKDIQRERSICDHCFRKVYNKDTDWVPDHVRQGVKDMVTNPRYDGMKENTDMVPNLNKYEYGETRSCKCGSVDFKPYNRPLKKGVFMEYAENLVERLQEQDKRFDEAEFLHLCEDLKSEGNLKDDLIYCEVTQELTG